MKGCKDCPAYAKCTVTYRGSSCAALRASYGVDSDPEIVTNADKIRLMSDQELADFILGIRDDDDYCGKVIRGCYFPACNVDDIIEWLQCELKEE